MNGKIGSMSLRTCGAALAVLAGAQAAGATTAKNPPVASSADAHAHTHAEQGRTPVQRLGYMVGSWSGTKIETLADGTVQRSPSRDDIRHAFGGQAIIIEGTAYPVGTSTSVEPVGRTLAVLSGHSDPNKVRVTGYLPQEIVVTEGAVAADGAVSWTFAAGQINMAFAIKPNGKGGWLEQVRYTGADGKTLKHFEIDFNRAQAAPR